MFLHLDFNNEQQFSFLVDSQADISLLKLSVIPSNLSIDSTNIVKIKGVTSGSVESFGTISSNLIVNGSLIPHIFHIVDDKFPIPTNGILGKDFLRNYRCNLDYDSKILSFQHEKNEFHIPFTETYDENEIYIAPRCEIVRIIPSSVRNPIVISDQTSPGVFIANTLSETNKTIIRIMNTNEDTVSINLRNIKIDSLDNYDIVNMRKTKKPFEADRISELKKILKNQIPIHVSKSATDLCIEYADIFALSNDKATTNNFYTQKLNVTDNQPVYQPNYRLPHAQKQVIRDEIQKLIDNDLIEPSLSSYNSPLLLVPKKSTDGKIKHRMVIDYRNVNRKLVPDKFPLPRIDDILDSLGNAKYFSVIDLNAGFHQIPLAPESRPITSFSFDNSHYQWKVLPFGLSISPNSFSRMMASTFRGVPLDTCFLYIDDIIVIGRSEKHHLENLRTVFERCRKHNLKLNPQKCQFFRCEVQYLGHTCTDKGLKPNQEKTKAVENYPRPHDGDSTKRFVAFANFYRRFIPRFAELAKPLNALCRKNAIFNWTPQCQEAFEKIKSIMISPQILAYPDFSKEFEIFVDASKIGCGAVLTQNHDGIIRPIYFASKSFTKGEQNKSTIEQELIAIHWAIKQFRPYIYQKEFTVRSDHKPLVYLFGLKDPSSRLTRVRVDLEEHTFTVKHVPGKENVCADALSRINIEDLKNIHQEACNVRAITRSKTLAQKAKIPLNEPVTEKSIEPHVIETVNNTEQIGIPHLKCDIDELPNHLLNVKVHINHKRRIKHIELNSVEANQFVKLMFDRLESMTDRQNFDAVKISIDDQLFGKCSVNKFKEIGNSVLKKLTVFLVRPIRHIDDVNERKTLIQTHHDDKLYGGHKGRRRLFSELRSMYFWKHMTKDIANYVKNCKKCHLNKPKNKNIENLKITETPQSAFDKVVIDTIGPMPKSANGNVYAITMICDLSKYIIAVPAASKDAKTVAKAIFENLILTFGNVKQFLTDCGTEYMNQVFSELCKLLNISHQNSTPYHHETLGSIERNHRVFNEYLRSYLAPSSDWEENLKYFTFCYNNSPHSSYFHKYTPFELVFGKKCNLPEFDNKIDPVYNIDNYVAELKYKLQHASKAAREMIIKHKNDNKKCHDKNARPLELQINDKVVLCENNRHKHEAIYSGPYIVEEIFDENVKISNPSTKKDKIVHKNNVRKYMN